MHRRTTTAHPDFRRLFESAPGLYLALSPDLVVVAASDAWLEATRLQREDVVGHGIDEVFPHLPDNPFAIGAGHVRASVARAIARRRPDEMPLLTHDVPNSADAAGGPAERYWKSVNSPVFARDGSVAWVIHQAEDITELVRMSERLRLQAAAHRRTLVSLRESEERYRQLFLTSPEPMWICDRATLGFLAVNDAALRLYGYSLEEFAQMTLRDMRPAGDLQALIEHLVGEQPTLGGTRAWRHVARSGRVIDVELSTRPLPFAGRDAVLVHAREVPPREPLASEARDSARRAEALARELQHVLATMMGHAGRLESRFPEGDAAHDDAQAIVQASLRAVALAERIPGLGRPPV